MWGRWGKMWGWKMAKLVRVDSEFVEGLLGIYYFVFQWGNHDMIEGT